MKKKRILVLMMAVIMIFSITSCGDSGTISSSSSSVSVKELLEQLPENKECRNMFKEYIKEMDEKTNTIIEELEYAYEDKIENEDSVNQYSLFSMREEARRRMSELEELTEDTLEMMLETEEVDNYELVESAFEKVYIIYGEKIGDSIGAKFEKSDILDIY